MNSIGIGKLKHASPVKVETSKPQKFNARAREDALPQKEGQLSVDIYQSEDKMIIVCPIAGVEKSDIKLAIQDDVLTIRGERRAVPDVKNKNALVSELFWGTFSRSIVLPDHIDRKNIAAKVNDSLLIITIPKTEDFKTRIIHINDENE